jgi:hypothetical protein
LRALFVNNPAENPKVYEFGLMAFSSFRSSKSIEWKYTDQSDKPTDEYLESFDIVFYNVAIPASGWRKGVPLGIKAKEIVLNNANNVWDKTWVADQNSV